MLSPDKYARYREISREGVRKTVTLSILFRDIAEREKALWYQERAAAAAVAGVVGVDGAAFEGKSVFSDDGLESC